VAGSSGVMAKKRKKGHLNKDIMMVGQMDLSIKSSPYNRTGTGFNGQKSASTTTNHVDLYE
jgi:hypothetical protein